MKDRISNIIYKKIAEEKYPKFFKVLKTFDFFDKSEIVEDIDGTIYSLNREASGFKKGEEYNLKEIKNNRGVYQTDPEWTFDFSLEALKKFKSLNWIKY